MKHSCEVYTGIRKQTVWTVTYVDVKAYMSTKYKYVLLRGRDFLHTVVNGVPATFVTFPDVYGRGAEHAQSNNDLF